MANTNISSEIAIIALDRAEGSRFEQFSNDFISAIEGCAFIPLGGTHDGGADGFRESEIYESTRNNVFYQFTVQEDHRGKIVGTIKRLKEFGRIPKTLYYFTSRLIPHIDIEEEVLSEKLNVLIRIRDKKYILSHLNDNNSTKAAFNNYLVQYTDFLKNIGASATLSPSEHVTDPSVYVFLQQEVSNRLGKNTLLQAITDSLILWALNGTDPDKGIFLSRNEIFSMITKDIPWAKNFIKGQLDLRLKVLSSKGETDREIKWHKKLNKFCLPFETRMIVEEENSKDLSLKIMVIDEFKQILSGVEGLDDSETSNISNIAVRVIELLFEKEGLYFSYFLLNKDEKIEPYSINDRIEEALGQFEVDHKKINVYREALRSILARCFYHSTSNQREFLYNLSRTYILLFSLKAEPRIIEYFHSMTSNFQLFVGSDILVQALSERFLEEEDQMARNMLRISAEAGVKLILTDPILEEVYTHIQATIFEFNNHFLEIEKYITRDIARNSDKILIRAYFYAKYEKKVSNWTEFIGKFLTHKIHLTSLEKKELCTYITCTFNMDYLPRTDIELSVNMDDVIQLKEKLTAEKEREELAYNSALMVHTVYSYRTKGKESTSQIEYGFKTWWLTKQTKIQKYTYDLVDRYHAKYIMRPEFLLNFFAMSPQKVEVLRSYKNIFPSVLGVQMGHRIKEETMQQILKQVKDWKDHEPGRVSALVADLCDKLKSDQKKIYEDTLKFFPDK